MRRINEFNTFFRNRKYFLVFLLIAIGLLCFVNWIWDTQGQGSALNYLSLFIAVVATMAALWSMKLTRDSLTLTRAAERPFLGIQVNISKGISLDRAILTLEIENTGNLPGDQVMVDCSWNIEETDNTEQRSLEVEKPSQSIIFPGDKAKSTYLVNGREDVSNLTHEGSRVKVKISYQNKLTGQLHTTRRTFRIAFASAAPSFDVAQAIVVPEEDYWD